MPRKKKDEGAGAIRQVAPREAASECGHVNSHWTGDSEMACELPKGHKGNHEADYQSQVPGGESEKARASWADMAGTPVAEFERDIKAQINARIQAAIESQKQAAEALERQMMN